MFYTIITILAIIVAILLILVVLIQNSKGGGLSSSFGGSSQIMGVQKTSDVLEKATWILAVSIFVLALIASLSVPKTSSTYSINTEIATPKTTGFDAPMQQQQMPVTEQEFPAQE